MSEKPEEPGKGEEKNKGGRPKGAMSKRTLGDMWKVQEVMQAAGYDPIGALIEEAKREENPEKRIAIHRSLIPYVYQKLPEIRHEEPEAGEDGLPKGKGGLTVNVVL